MGSDKKPRTYRASSMNNLAQFNQRPEEFAKYLKEEKGVDIAGNSGIVKAFLIFCVAMITIFGGLWLYNHYKNRKDDNIKNQYWYWKGQFLNAFPIFLSIRCNELSIRRHQVINSVSIRFRRLSIRYQFGFGDYQFGINSV